MTDQRTVRTVVIGLALTVLAGLGGVIALAVLDLPVPELLGTITTTALGALAALLASTRVGGEPQQVQVANEPGDPIPVEEALPVAAKDLERRRTATPKGP